MNINQYDATYNIKVGYVSVLVSRNILLLTFFKAPSGLIIWIFYNVKVHFLHNRTLERLKVYSLPRKAGLAKIKTAIYAVTAITVR